MSRPISGVPNNLSSLSYLQRIRGFFQKAMRRIMGLVRSIPVLVFLSRRLRGMPCTFGEVSREIRNRKAMQMKKRLVSRKTFGADARPFDTGLMDRVRNMAAQIPTSSSGRYYRPWKKRVGLLSDEFLYNTYKSVADTVAIHPDKWEQQIEGLDMLLIISGWRGIEEEWRGFAQETSKKRKMIYQIIDACKGNDIITLFYSIEDPPNYNAFKGIAQKCDDVFTTAEEMVVEYEKDCGHNRVCAIPFAINPLFHNPVGMRHFNKLEDVVFSGSWLDKYPERGHDICTIFDGVIASKRRLQVIDRNFDIDQSTYQFPEKYNEYIAPAVDHDMLQRVHKLYDWAINMNSVKKSPTMFANRAYELEGAGNLMLSNYSVGVNARIPLIFTAQNSAEVTRILNAYTPEQIYEWQITGIRHAMTGNTCFDRFFDMIAKMDGDAPLQKRVVAVAVAAKKTELEKMFMWQSYPWKALVSFDELEVSYQEYDLVTFFEPDGFYDIFYLEDMINTFKYTDSSYVTKLGVCEEGVLKNDIEHEFTNRMESKYRTIFWREDFTARQLIDMQGAQTLTNGYSTDHFNYEYKRLPASEKQRQYKLSVIIPVYNNGVHLYGKAFGSLMRSSMFMDMEILLVDDGSTDGITDKYVRYLAGRYTNVQAFYYDDGGSGSASRPRNKGMELATADYVTWLDPDNEAINDGYALLYKIVTEEGVDLALGNMMRYKETEELANYYYYFSKLYGSDVVEGEKTDFFHKIKYTPMSIQAMVVKKSIITDSGIEQVVGAVGQDSFFSWQLLYEAKSIKAIETPIHIYYAMVTGSTVNKVGLRYFQKCLPIEKAQFAWLKERGMLEDYMDARFNTFWSGWNLKKLGMATEEERPNCVKVLAEAMEEYVPYYNKKDEEINAFLREVGLI